MPAFTLYGARGSTNTDRVRLTLAEGGFADYKLVLINLQKGEQKPEQVICKYLAKKYCFLLLPPDSDREATALFEQAQSEEMSYFADPASKIAFEKFVKQKFMGLPPDETVVSGATRSIEAFFDLAERALQHSDYMAGEDFTLVDIYYVPLIQRLFVCGYADLILGRKAVSAWWNRVINRPVIQQVLTADKEAAKATQ
ncbi:Glutathione S-transferase [Colletotrichum aenigma]|uniref:Glutathione S-transferase n=1 Tax=Colletotrichum aenigma TaxID=1215731 RepID=UPI001872B2BD|nr:Glutathione S-transferase [Colletotrichum aenigma]KAF5502845.1 Glutathione S-transferase [Colletotrichum aenigma]